MGWPGSTAQRVTCCKCQALILAVARYPVAATAGTSGGGTVLQRFRASSLLAALLLLAACAATEAEEPNGDDEPPPPPTYPDLAAHWIRLSPDPLELLSQDAVVTFVVANSGDAPAERTLTRVELEVETAPGVHEAVSSFDALTPAIDRGGAAQLTVQLWWNEPLPFGDHRVVVTVDANGELEQTNRANDRAERSVSLPHPCADPSSAVVFADELLQAYVAQALGLESLSVTCDELQDLTAIAAGYLGIGSLGGVEMASRLRAVDVAGGPIDSLAPLTALEALRELMLSHVDATGLAVIAQLEGLEHLSLHDSAAHDLSFVHGLQHLRRLELHSSNVHDVASLSRLPDLDSVALVANPVTDLAPLADLPRLWSLTLEEMQPDDWGFLAELESLNHLALGRNSNFHSAALTHLPESVRGLWIYDQELDGLAFLRETPQLESLALMGTDIVDASVVGELTSLVDLNLVSNRITDLSFLAGLTQLSYLGLTQNRITSIEPLLDLELGSGDLTIDLVYNCLDHTPGSDAWRVVTELESRGVTVWWEPQEECGVDD